MLHKLGEQIQGKPTVAGGTQRWIGSIGVAVAVGIAYFLAARLGLALLNEPERVAVFWPAAGVAAGTLVALGRWARAPVAVAVMVASIAASLTGDRSIWAALSFALCNAGESLLTAWLIERFFGPHFSLDNLRKVLGLLASAAVASAAAAVAAAVAMRLFGPSRRRRRSASGGTGSYPTPSASSRLRRC
jgi:integral membrane sensor domain MASE1